jgi:hypothetical protein
MAIHKNTAISKVTVRSSGGYQFHLLNECNSPDDIKYFERPGMLTVHVWGLKHRTADDFTMSFVNYLEDGPRAPWFWNK